MEQTKRCNIVGMMVLYSVIFLICACLGFAITACTYSITIVHTEGVATDVVDETATNTPSTSVSIPVSAAGL